MPYNEADTRAILIDPKLLAAGWSNDLISREFPISAGRIEIIGEIHRRAAPRKADYVLRLAQHGEALAVVEAKEEDASAAQGMVQAKEYAQKLNLLFAYATNGHKIEEFNFHTNKQTTIKEFPSPQELKKRYSEAILAGAVVKGKAEKILEEPFYYAPSFSLRYYQEAAVHNAIKKITKGDKRVLLTLATGTGKTVIAFNLIWRLIKSGYFKRVLFVADRNFLRNQAYNVFAPFGDARALIEEGKTPRHQQVFFSIYQALFSPGASDKRLFEEYDPDFFDLIVIDECHRSGFGSWKDILNHFTGAVHLGMTATPKRSDNIDTYKYFGEPAYLYSYGQGVQDGYLAPFVVHRVLTDIDREGKLTIEEAQRKGAKIFAPADTEVQDEYSQKEFERRITIPDRTHEIALHLAKLLKTFGPMAKTMVFCVDSDHADLMAKELQNEFADLGHTNFAVSIIARNGDILDAEYERFKDSEKPTPVIATTVDLLTTGIDVPSVRNIVIVKPIGSKIVFKQIIGRGSRIDPLTNKYYFRIIDYIGATRLFDDWEKIPEPKPQEPEGEEKYIFTGVVLDAETQDPIPGATVVLQRRDNEQFYERADKDGLFTFAGLPQKTFHLTVRATGYKTKSLAIMPVEKGAKPEFIELIPQGKRPKKVIVKGLPVHIAEEERLVLEKEGRTLKVEEYVDYARKEVAGKVRHIEDLREVWLEPDKRKVFLEELSQKSIYPELIAELKNRPDLDGFDILANVAFGVIPLSRDERAETLQTQSARFLAAFSEDAREVVHALIERYRLAGIEDIENPLVFQLPPFDRMGGIHEAERRFGTIDKLKVTIGNIRKRIYADAS
ncbi:MAG: DEAD/DEAH box helicase family protein [Candidatus Margulisiibacteriota bacterium]